jgi:alkylation response protein AidB-like acyl-CoA dehydrogenase
MATYTPPLREIEFVLKDVLNVGALAQFPGLAEATPDLIGGLIGEAGKILSEQLAPLNMTADAGCKFESGNVRTPAGFKEFYRQWWQGGWCGISLEPEFGGQGLPYTLGKVLDELMCSASVAFALYPGLTTGCYEAIHACGSDEQKKTYLPKLASGEWGGTMCITEPQAGSDVGSIKTRALPQADGSWALEGNKIFISSGEHDLTDNIIHFVLARLPDSPPGVKGLSTFIVPKFLVNADGSLGARNPVRCVSIEHKMGLHGSCTAALAFEGARGWMIGAPNTGIQNMFVMMNLARILVGLQGLGQCELATQNAIRYAQDRKQGKAASGSPLIIDHADVRRMLLQMKAITEGARVLAYETAIHVDLARHHPDAAARAEAQDWVELTTPLTKSFCTDSAFELGSLAIQVYGGHGYIKEHGIEQIARDSKILCLYEGTNGIQAMDLVRRKLMMHNGRLAQRFFARARGEIGATAPLGFVVRPLSKALDELEATTAWVQKSYKDTPDDAAFGCVDFQRAFALTYLGYNWLRMAKAAHRSADENFKRVKLATAEYFATRMLTQVPGLCVAVRNAASGLMQVPASAF